MMSRLCCTLALAALFTAHAGAAADASAGKTLVDTNCHHCHGNEIYTRKDRRISDLGQLRSQVRRCELSLGLKWFDDEINNATAYLNQQFYQFK